MIEPTKIQGHVSNYATSHICMRVITQIEREKHDSLSFKNNSIWFS